MTPIVLIPGLLCSAEVFAAQATALWPYGPVTIASTLTGRSMAQMASAILAAAPPRFALGGISMGGYLCFEIMRRAPERVIKLALLDTSARPDTPAQTEHRRALLAKFRTKDFRTVFLEAYSGSLHPSRRDDATLHELNVRMALQVGLDGFERQTEAIIARPDSRPMLSTISVPALVLVGDSDPSLPPHLSEEIAAGISGSRLVVIPECGHCSTLEQPELVNRALLEWVSGSAAAA
jgi:pimeloyl-ACP methyl ester carboxylesterase